MTKLWIFSLLVTAALSPAQGQEVSFPATGTPSCDSFYNSLTRTDATTIDGFLAQISRDPSLSRNITAKSAMYRSRAMHGTSLEDPRALIMYGLGDMVLAFNGNRDQLFYDVLEVMCYNTNAARFEFRAIQFAGDAQPQSRSLEEIEHEIRGGNIKVTKANPTACASCHGSEYVRPAWESYLAWAGSYGSYEEAYYIPNARFAHEPKQTEYTGLTQFIARAAAGKERYGRFRWSNSSIPDLQTINNALFGILINYKMSNPALRDMLNRLKQPEYSKYKYAFAGYLLECNEDSFLPRDSRSDLADFIRDMSATRASFEMQQRLNLNQDLANLGENLVWKDRDVPSHNFDSSPQRLRDSPSGMAYMIVVNSRGLPPDWMTKLARMENLYNTMGLSTDPLHIGDGKTSWDGYNEIQDYMADYLLRFYGLPEIVPIQKIAAENRTAVGVHRNDLDTRLSDYDYQTVLPGLRELQLPAMQNGNRRQLCRDLSAASRAALRP